MSTLFESVLENPVSVKTTKLNMLNSKAKAFREYPLPYPAPTATPSPATKPKPTSTTSQEQYPPPYPGLHQQIQQRLQKQVQTVQLYQPQSRTHRQHTRYQRSGYESLAHPQHVRSIVRFMIDQHLIVDGEAEARRKNFVYEVVDCQGNQSQKQG